MSETNGNGKSRLDRIEQMIERQVLANEAAHERFEAEDRRLLTAQILMNNAMTKMHEAMTKMEESSVKRDAAMEKMALAMAETTGKLDALIAVVDGVIRRPKAE